MAQLTGPFHVWGLGPQPRRYAQLTIPLSELMRVCRSNPYDARTGKGEQRDIIPAHANRLFNEMMNGTFTPTTLSLGLNAPASKKVEYGDGVFSLEVDEKHPLPLTDGGHRLAALGKALFKYEADLKLAGEKESVTVQESLSSLLMLPVPVLLHLDGDPQLDFTRLQLGRPVDRTHLLSLRLQRFQKDPVLSFAYEVAKTLDGKKGSPYEGRIRFDSHGELAPLPVTTLFARNSSDIGVSLVGAARIAATFAMKKPEWVAGQLIEIYDQMGEKAGVAYERGKALTPPAKGGTKGAATMFVGVLNCHLWRLGSLQKKKADGADWEKMAGAVMATLDVAIQRAFPSPLKRELLGQFAQAYLGDIGDLTGQPMHEGIPRGLIETLSSSTFAVAPIPKKAESAGEVA